MEPLKPLPPVFQYECSGGARWTGGGGGVCGGGVKRCEVGEVVCEWGVAGVRRGEESRDKNGEGVGLLALVDRVSWRVETNY